MSQGYDRYVEKCRARGQEPPTQAWWDWACSRRAYSIPRTELMREIQADQREIDRERREGWAYD
jgi:hypothetical protein